MTAVLAIAVLAALCAGLAVLIAYRERAHDRERDSLLDRITAPEIVHAATAARLMPPPPKAEPEPDVFIAVTDDDLLLDGQLDPI